MRWFHGAWARGIEKSAGVALCVLLSIGGCGGAGAGPRVDTPAPPDPDQQADLAPFPPLGPSLPVVHEDEENDGPATASWLGVGSAGAGRLDAPGDRDLWAFYATSGEVLGIEVDAARSDQSGWEAAGNRATVALLDRDGSRVLRAVDDLLPWDPSIRFWRAAATGTYFVAVQPRSRAAPGAGYVLRVFGETLREPVQTESRGEATSGPPQKVQPGTVLCSAAGGELDAFEFDLLEPSWVRVRVHQVSLGAPDAPGSPLVRLHAPDGSLLTETDGGSAPQDVLLTCLCPAAGTWGLTVLRAAESPEGPYVLELERGPIGTMAEAEPNDQFQAATPLVPDASVAGQSDATTSDYYGFSGSAGEWVRFWVYDLGHHPAAVARIRANLHVVDPTTTPPSLDGISSSGLSAGPRLIGAILPRIGDYVLRIRSDSESTPYALRMERLAPAQPEAEPNDAIETASALGTEGRVWGHLDVPGDLDMYVFRATAEVVVRILAHAAEADPPVPDREGFGSGAYLTLAVLDETGRVLAHAATDPYLHALLPRSRGEAPSGELVFVPPSEGTYRLAVTAPSGGGQPWDSYVIEVHGTQP